MNKNNGEIDRKTKPDYKTSTNTKNNSKENNVCFDYNGKKTKYGRRSS